MTGLRPIGGGIRAHHTSPRFIYHFSLDSTPDNILALALDHAVVSGFFL